MGKISTDQKLQLVRMIRAENQDNRMKMRSRERMLYGTESGYRETEEFPLYTRGYYEGYKGKKELYALEDGAESLPGGPRGPSFSSFKLRLFLSVFLFAGFLILDAGGGSVAGITTKQLQEEINKDFDAGLDTIVFDFENNFPYTLFEEPDNG